MENSAAPKKTATGASKQQQMYILGGVVALAVVAAVVFIFLNLQGGSVNGGKFDYASIPSSRTADGAFVLGDPNAPVTVVEFADFQCPHCQTYTSTIDQVIENLVLTGKAKLEYRYFPIVDRQAFTARLVECVAGDDPVRFWEAHDLMFDLNRRGWNQTSAEEFARRMNTDYGNLLNCVASDADQYETDVQLGTQPNVGVTGTPAIRIRVGDGAPEPIGANYASGGIPYSVIEAAVNAFQ